MARRSKSLTGISLSWFDPVEFIGKVEVVDLTGIGVVFGGTCWSYTMYSLVVCAVGFAVGENRSLDSVLSPLKLNTRPCVTGSSRFHPEPFFTSHGWTHCRT